MFNQHFTHVFLDIQEELQFKWNVFYVAVIMQHRRHQSIAKKPKDPQQKLMMLQSEHTKARILS